MVLSPRPMAPAPTAASSTTVVRATARLPRPGERASIPEVPAHPAGMASYRVTFRYGAPRVLYEVLDVEAADIRAALRAAADKVSDPVASTAELVELRLQSDPAEREYTPE